MKKLLFPVLLAASLLGLQSCSEDFEVAAPYKPVTVVYGILDLKDTAHYIRIQKSFLDEQKNAFDMARISDSSFYKEGDLEVMIKEMSGNTTIGQPIMLQRVDMDAEGYKKDTGTFFNTPHYAYKFKKVLNPAYTYRLLINNKLTNTRDSADIELVDSTTLTILGANRKLNFANTDPNLAGNTFAVFGNPGDAQYLEAYIRFRWVERLANGTGGTKDSADFMFASTTEPNDFKNGLKVANSKIWGFLQTVMGPAPEGYARYMDSCDVIIYGAGREYAEYIETLQIQSSGLTADQIKPQYTNIRGKDVFGLFTSKTTRVLSNAYIDDMTLQALNSTASMRDLKISTQRADP
jgi:hypothetical protein